MAAPQPTQQQVIQTYRSMQSELKSIAEKIHELESELAEHVRVAETLKPLSPTRKAYRMIGDVLVARTVEDVLPAVLKNQEGISQVVNTLNSSLKEKEKVAQEFQQKYNIKAQRE